MKKYIVAVQEAEDGELFIELPEDVLETLDLAEGDMVRWTPQDDGSFILTKGYLKEPIQLDMFQ